MQNSGQNSSQFFESVLVSALAGNSEFFSKVFGIVKPKYFKDALTREVFNLLTQHFKTYQEKPSLDDLKIQVKNLQSDELRTSLMQKFQTLQEIDTKNFKTENLCDETLKWVKDALYLEALEIGSEGLMTKNDDLKRKAEQILDERAKVSIDSDLGIEFSETENVLDYYEQALSGLMTQHQSLNMRLGSGFLPKTLSLVLAPSGIGKSLWLTDLASGWIKAGKNVLLVSLEMQDKEVLKRVHSNVLEIPIADFLPHRFNRQHFLEKMQNFRNSGGGLFYTKDYPAQSFSATQLDALLESFKNEKGLEFDVVMVDYIGIMKSDLMSPSAGLYSYVKSIAEEVRAVASKRNIPIISCSQLNRSATNNTSSDNAAVSDSYGSVMTADFMLFLLQTEEMKETGDIVCKITKNRFSGKTETFPMKVDYNLMRFVDPEMPATLEGKKEFMNNFDLNVQKTETLVHEDFSNNVRTAQEINKQNSSNARNDLQSGNDLQSALDELMKL